MKRLAFGAAAAAGTAFALHRLAKVRHMHAHCREMVRTHCGGTDTSCQRPPCSSVS